MWVVWIGGRVSRVLGWDGEVGMGFYFISSRRVIV